MKTVQPNVHKAIQEMNIVNHIDDIVDKTMKEENLEKISEKLSEAVRLNITIELPEETS